MGPGLRCRPLDPSPARSPGLSSGPCPYSPVRPPAGFCGLPPGHGAAAPLVLQPARWLDLYGSLPGRAHAPGAADDPRREAPWRFRPGVTQAAARPGQALFRVHRVLDLPDVGAVPGYLVREPA